MHVRPVVVDEVVLAAIASLGTGAPDVDVAVPETLPEVEADAALFERAVANLIGNAARASPRDHAPRVEADVVGSERRHVDIRVIDRDRASGSSTGPVFEPSSGSVTTRPTALASGLGLAIARGFVEAMHGELAIEDTPGGGRRSWSPPGARAAGAPTVTRVLVVDDEAPIRRAPGGQPQGARLRRRAAETGEQALGWSPAATRRGAARPGPAGHGRPGGDRRAPRLDKVPIVVLSARDAEPDKVAALDTGADDYVSKPFGMDELLARLRAAVRRSLPAEEEPVVRTDAFTIDLAAKRVLDGDGAAIQLTPTEWHLLEVLVRHAGKLVTQRQLLRDVWGPQYGNESNYLRVHLAHLRRKLEPDRADPRYLLTEPGLGYRFVP